MLALVVQLFNEQNARVKSLEQRSSPALPELPDVPRPWLERPAESLWEQLLYGPVDARTSSDAVSSLLQAYFTHLEPVEELF